MYMLFVLYLFSVHYFIHGRGRRGRDRMVVGFTTTYAISVYHHQSCEFEPYSWRGVFDTTLCDKVCKCLTAGRCFFLSGYYSNLQEYHWLPRYSWHIVESGIKHHKLTWLSNSGINVEWQIFDADILLRLGTSSTLYEDDTEKQININLRLYQPLSSQCFETDLIQ